MSLINGAHWSVSVCFWQKISSLMSLDVWIWTHWGYGSLERSNHGVLAFDFKYPWMLLTWVWRDCQDWWSFLNNLPFRENVFRTTLNKVLGSSKAESTIRKYNNAIAAWKVWCDINHLSHTHPSHLDLARYFVYLFNSNAPFSKIETAFFAIKWKIDCSPDFCQQNPCDLKFLKLLLDGFKRLLAKPVNRKEPITPEIMQALVQKFDNGGLRGLFMLYGVIMLCRFSKIWWIIKFEIVWCWNMLFTCQIIHWKEQNWPV